MTYTYYWYDHGMLRGTKIYGYIQKAIEEHDWKTFNLFRNVLNGYYNLTFFPNTIYVSDSSHIPLNKENFKKITDNECENG